MNQCANEEHSSSNYSVNENVHIVVKWERETKVSRLFAFMNFILVSLDLKKIYLVKFCMNYYQNNNVRMYGTVPVYETVTRYIINAENTNGEYSS